MDGTVHTCARDRTRLPPDRARSRGRHRKHSPARGCPRTHAPSRMAPRARAPARDRLQTRGNPMHDLLCTLPPQHATVSARVRPRQRPPPFTAARAPLARAPSPMPVPVIHYTASSAHPHVSTTMCRILRAPTHLSTGGRSSDPEGENTNESTGQSHPCSRGHWRPEEDSKLKHLVSIYGPQNWNLIAEKLHNRSGKSCRLRWFNQLNPRINRSAFKEEEEEKLMAAHRLRRKLCCQRPCVIISGSSSKIVRRLFIQYYPVEDSKHIFERRRKGRSADGRGRRRRAGERGGKESDPSAS
ncbi:Transcription factor MYB44 [Platanthera guangdongensis]|uniref:Transcription factor MYB44 n=1 Tax=Platanthera guangdongensis TaxID=2320717 RepID=A0ABR2LJE7_9ASPA